MRLLRVLAVAFGLASLLSQSSAAQDGRQFKDAWFWGAKLGALSFTSLSSSNSSAPMVGGEWLITRSTGGLYMSLDQAFFTTQGGFRGATPDSTFTRSVNLKDMRRFTFAAMVFPGQSNTLHPYAGLGFVFNQIANATLLTGSLNNSAADSIQAKKTAFSPILIGGVQSRKARASVFLQASASPIQSGFFLSNSALARSFNYTLEAGVRYNVGSSIERAK